MWNREIYKMNRKHYAWCGIAIALGIGAAVGWSVTTGNYLLPLAAVVVGMALKYLCRRRVTEVIEDELIYRISEKASYQTLRVSLVAMAIIAGIFIALSKNGPAALEQIGLTLAFVVCALLIVHILFHGYYSRKGVE
jgi:uncharacterized membrane protein